MAYRFQSKFRILARHENRSVSVFRKCSSQELPPKSPIVVPRITIKGNNSFGNKTTRPSPKVAACIMLQGKPNNFQDSEELIEGSLHAVELITQTLSKTQDLQNSDLVEYTSEQCFKQIMSMYSGSQEYENFKKGKSEKFSGSVMNGKNIDSKDVEEFFQKLEQHMHKAQKFARENSLILKEDIFFSWIENMNPEKTQMRIGTMSFPHLGEILNKIQQIEDKQDRMKYIESVFPDINMNSVVCCNWDFNKVKYYTIS